ncbi:MAG: hypothetical protein AAGA85_03730 [Bacteroidota bacterium]
MAQRKEQPQWLIETQNNSWNPELLISGISILFIFAFGDRLNDFAIGVIQDYGVNPALILLAVGYVTVAVQALKYAFVLHLVMRGVWVGLVGLNYAFPEGIRVEKLPKVSRQPFFLQDLKDTIDIIMRVERICSSIFSIAFMLVGISGWILLFLVPCIVLSILGVPLTWLLMGLVALLVILSASSYLYFFFDQRLGIKVPLLSSIFLLATKSQALLFFRESLLTYQTNLNKKVSTVFFMGFFMLAGFQTGGLIGPAVDFTRDLTPESALLPGLEIPPRDRSYQRIDPMVYLSNFKDYQRVRKVAIPEPVVYDNMLPLYHVAARTDRSLVKADSTKQLGHLATVLIDGAPLEAEWKSTFLPTNDQEVWVAYLDLAEMSRGEHVLTIDKWVWHPYEKRGVFFENWSSFSFWLD